MCAAGQKYCCIECFKGVCTFACTIFLSRCPHYAVCVLIYFSFFAASIFVPSVLHSSVNLFQCFIFEFWGSCLPTSCYLDFILHFFVSFSYFIFTAFSIDPYPWSFLMRLFFLLHWHAATFRTICSHWLICICSPNLPSLHWRPWVGLLFCPEDGSSRFLWKAGKAACIHTVSLLKSRISNIT